MSESDESPSGALPHTLTAHADTPTAPQNFGVNFDTDWTRTRSATLFRDVCYTAFVGPLSRFICSPRVHGVENFSRIERPIIFTPNHVSHFDTLAVLCTLPRDIRKHIVVAAAVDNFFDKRWKSIFYSLLLGTIPVERTRINRKSADVAANLIDAGYNLLIFPEGGRSYTDEMMEFRGGAAYLAKRCNAPVVPVYLRGVRQILPKGSTRLRRASIDVYFGTPMRPKPAEEPGTKEEDARRFTKRIQTAVAGLRLPNSIADSPRARK